VKGSKPEAQSSRPSVFHCPLATDTNHPARFASRFASHLNLF
jgi:hypothetical protein